MKKTEANIFKNKNYTRRVIIVEPTDLFIECSFDYCKFVNIEGNLKVFQTCWFDSCNLTDRQALDLNLSSSIAYPNPLIGAVFVLSKEDRMDTLSVTAEVNAMELTSGTGDKCKWYHYALGVALLSPLIYDFISIMGAQ